MSDKEYLVSVIVPVYNVEQYLDKCISSIVNQTYKNLEIILVDDGSPDNCPAMCDEWAEKDSRIRVIHKVHSDAGITRNAGIEIANGDYICFCDSDDYIASDTIEKCINKVSKTNAEAVLYGLVSVDKNGKTLNLVNFNIDSFYFEGNQVTEQLLPELISHNFQKGEGHNFLFSACLGLFSFKVIKENNIRFPAEKEIISEDSYFLLQLYSKLQSVVLIPEALYFHFVNTSSLSLTYNADRQERNNLFLKKAIQLIEALNLSNEIKYRLTMLYHDFTIEALKQTIGTDKQETDKRHIISEILKNPLFKSTLGFNIIKMEKKTIMFFNICAKYKLYYFCYLMLKLKNVRNTCMNGSEEEKC